MVNGWSRESSLTTVRMNNIFISRYRFYLVFLAVLLAFTTLGGRLVQLQYIDAQKYKEVALGVRQNFITTPARRGDVVDRKGNLLATTRSVVELGLDPHSIEEKDLGIYQIPSFPSMNCSPTTQNSTKEEQTTA